MLFDKKIDWRALQILSKSRQWECAKSGSSTIRCALNLSEAEATVPEFPHCDEHVDIQSGNITMPQLCTKLITS